jgi:solute carrier family 25 carnitine/acylcarnitine transporter 20/29
VDFFGDLVCGSISGVGSCLSGFVLDTAKVKMQVERVGMIKCILNTMRNEGLAGLYRGVYYPLLTNPVVTALNFGVYEFYKKFKGQR